MTQNYPYATYLDVRYPPLEVIDVPAIRRCRQRPVVQPDALQGQRLGRPARRDAGRVSLHKHDDLDEFFYVVEGKF